MKVLMSLVSTQEAVIAWQCGADIIDIKTSNEGSLGTSFPWIIQETIANIPDLNISFGTTLSKLSNDPGMAAFAALGAVHSGVKYVKVELYDFKSVLQSVEVMRAIVRTCKEYNSETTVIATSYADYQYGNGLSPEELIKVAVLSEADMVMLDTLAKDLFDVLNTQQIKKFVRTAHEAGLKVALAGAVKVEHLEALASIEVDIVGVHSAVCDAHDHSLAINPEKIKRFIEIAEHIC